MQATLIQAANWLGKPVDVLVEDGRITAMADHLSAEADTAVFNASGLVMWPGMVNTHHHLAQSIMKGIPAGINAGLEEWLGLVPFALWPHIDPETMYLAALTGFSELLRSGCTTCADHHYLYEQQGSEPLQEALLRAADEAGIRFILCRGGATRMGSHAGQRSGQIENERLDTWIGRLQDLLALHDPSPHAMRRLVVAPTSLVHSTGPDDLRVLAEFSRAHNLRMHSHLLEVTRDEEVCRETYGYGAVEYADSVGWLGEDVWFAHMVHVGERGIRRLAETGTGISHCPTSNCRLGSGISPVTRLVAAGVPVTLGVDGSASAESGSMANEAMLSWLLHRSQHGSAATQLDQVMHWATAAGADLLGLDCGRIRVGACADLVFYDISDPRYAGLWQPHYAPVLCGEPVAVQHVMINGKWVMSDGALTGIDSERLSARATAALQRLQRRV